MTCLLDALSEILKKATCKNHISIHPANHKDGTLIRSIVASHSRVNGPRDGDRRRNGSTLKGSYNRGYGRGAERWSGNQYKGNQGGGGRMRNDEYNGKGEHNDASMEQAQRYDGGSGRGNSKRRNVST